MEDKVNFQPFGSTILIDVGRTISKGGIVMPDQAKLSDVLEPGEAFRVVKITDNALDSLFGKNEWPDKMHGDFYVYLKPYTDPVLLFENDGIRYAIIEVHEIAGWAPEGFDREAWLKKKEDEREKKRELAKKIRERSVGLST